MKLNLNKIHHIAIICSNYERSKKFYTDILGLEIAREHYRAERDSYKLDLKLHDNYIIELFSFPSPPNRLSFPEAAGLRHLAFEVDNLDIELNKLEKAGILHEGVRIDNLTNKRFTFFFDPDQVPIELYER
ncbi:SMU1112c/YaeR family gloxylase I-like metalloprotein [Sphingobacterium multivorum]|uniref:SMU1112c/YaeR family gloxylase I-like metalloprotein n=1 Tax=Sphingobacterium multivorum TaxID=28454 RepID=UPI0031BA280A